jgi:hypothetical protein
VFDNELVTCHCGSGRKRGWWKPFCAACEKAWRARHHRDKDPQRLDELARGFESMRTLDHPPHATWH